MAPSVGEELSALPWLARDPFEPRRRVVRRAADSPRGSPSPGRLLGYCHERSALAKASLMWGAGGGANDFPASWLPCVHREGRFGATRWRRASGSSRTANGSCARDDRGAQRRSLPPPIGSEMTRTGRERPSTLPRYPSPQTPSGVAHALRAEVIVMHGGASVGSEVIGSAGGRPRIARKTRGW
jgi:hypothetical protein